MFWKTICLNKHFQKAQIMNRSKIHFRHVLMFLFDNRKSAAEAHKILEETYGYDAPSYSNCKFWFKRFKSDDFDLNDKERTGQPKKFEDSELQDLLNENSTQTENQLAKKLKTHRSTISRRLHMLGKIQKEGRWIPHMLSEIAISNRLNIAKSLLSRNKKKSFLWRIVTGDEKWIFFNNPKRKKSWLDPGQASTTTTKRNLYDHKVMLCIWWDMEGVVYHELLKQRETVTGERYRQQLKKLNEELLQKRPAIASNLRKVILLHDNARPHISSIVKQTLSDMDWEILPHPAYSPDIAPSDFHLFRSMAHSLADMHFKSYEDVQKWLTNWIDTKEKSFYKRGISKLPDLWEKVVLNGGKYFD